ncbi:hypothetical protein [Clostridium ganghwense]|uniref:Uncharacterized protein n=1 Tax=Clostridium ganghwense TaxID=312089 RepID=A0ABT4CM65_9CLOT|nr:hypothetical protein [Clostridium ganghwense]MCY6370131.1 hypothetical protein [Clostridium ganghwense]
MNKRIFKSVARIIVLVAIIGVMSIKSQSISMERELKTNLEIMTKTKRKNNEKVVIGYKKTIDLNFNKVVIVTIKKLLK